MEVARWPIRRSRTATGHSLSTRLLQIGVTDRCDAQIGHAGPRALFVDAELGCGRDAMKNSLRRVVKHVAIEMVVPAGYIRAQMIVDPDSNRGTGITDGVTAPQARNIPSQARWA